MTTYSNKNKEVSEFLQNKTKNKNKKDLVTHFSKLSRKLMPTYETEILPELLEDAKQKRRKTIFPKTTIQTVNRLIKEIAKLAGIEKSLSTHTARHTAAMLLLNDCGLPIETVSEILGHKDLKTTKIYAKILPETTGMQIDAGKPLK